MKTDIEIAQSAAMLPISQVAAKAGIDEEHILLGGANAVDHRLAT